VDGPGASRPIAVRDADSGGWVHVCHAENDYDAISGREAGVDEPDDAVDDAADVWVLYPQFFQWSGGLLGGIEYHWCGDPGLHNGLGPVEEPARLWTQAGSGDGYSSCRPCVGV